MPSTGLRTTLLLSDGGAALGPAEGVGQKVGTTLATVELVFALSHKPPLTSQTHPAQPIQSITMQPSTQPMRS